MKKILIGVVVVLLIAGVIGGSFAIANHFKKSEVTPDEKPVEQEKVFQNAVLSNGAKVDKIYINPDYTFNEADAEVFAGNKFFLMINENEFIGVDDKQSLFVTGSGNPLNNTLNYATMEYNHYEDMMGFYIGHTVGLSKPINNGTMIYTVQGALSDINVVYNAEEKSLDLSKLNYTLIINKERVNELKKIDFISLEPFYVSKADINNKPSDIEQTLPEVPEVKTSATSVLSSRQAVDKIYFNPQATGTIADKSMEGIWGMLVKTSELEKYTNAELFAPDTAFSPYNYINFGKNGGHIIFVSDEGDFGDQGISIDYWYVESAQGDSNGCKISYEKSSIFSIENDVLYLPSGYSLVIKDEHLNQIIDLNIFSTVPYPVVETVNTSAI